MRGGPFSKWPPRWIISIQYIQMRKIMLLALVVVAGSVFGATPDKKKKKKKNATEQKAEPVRLLTESDTLSYAAGVASTRGLVGFIQNEYGMDTAYVADFIEGYKEGIALLNDPKFVARNAGVQIARMVQDRILPQTKKQYEDTPHAIGDELFNSGFMAAVKGDSTVMSYGAAQKTYAAMHDADMARKQEAYKNENVEWLKANAAKEGVKTTASGLQYKVITAGNGEIPKATDEVKVKYDGKLIDGTEFDSSYKRNPQTTTFRADQVIKGWTEALTMMPVGSKWELYIPQELGYGTRQAGKIKPYSTLVFTVELVGIEKKEEKPSEADGAKADAQATGKKVSNVAPLKKARRGVAGKAK